jgi:NitT/TauT family transport system substrate-binding protein
MLDNNSSWNRKLRWRYFTAFLSLLLLSLPLPARSQERVRIAYATNSLAFLATFVTKDRGFYVKQGLDAEIVQVRPAVAIAALLSGDIDYVQVIGSVIRSAAKGAPIRAISTAARAPFFSLAAHPRFKSVRDMKGSSIGVTAIGGTNYFSARAIWRHFGLDPDKDAKIIAIGDEKLMYDALKIGRVDSALVAPPFSVLLKREGYPLLAHTAQILSIPFTGLGTTVDKIARNRAQVKKVMKAEIEALRYLHANPSGTIESIRKRFSMDERMARESYEVVIDAYSRDGKIPADGVDTLLSLEKQQNLIPQSITQENVIDTSLVEEVLKELGK